ncbi:MAG TPA: universal stress protein [Candidatus Tectomicrobia bacterium]|jgi:nucleotide-binding universal stress UspA family protein
MLYTHILVPTDFSTAANRALRYAFEEATQHQAKLTLLHVTRHYPTVDVYYIEGTPEQREGYAPERSGKFPALPTPPPEVVRRDYNEEALVQLQDLVPASFTGPWKAEVASGDPADAIVQVAQDLGVDLIVMATHGRTGLQHVFLGSVAEKVIRHAPCPVLTIRYRAATV